jgi:D-alanyl-D-alanine carboxypeptidase
MRATFTALAILVLTWCETAKAQPREQRDNLQSRTGSKTNSSAESTPTDDPKIKALLQKGVANGYPGIAMLVEDGPGSIRSAAAGFSDIEHKTSMRATDAFHIASISKTFTAVSVLRLIDQRKLSLQTTLKEALGDVAARIPYAERISVAQLLDHSSGIYATNNDIDYVSTLLGPKADPRRVWTPKELISLADKDRKPPMGEPGSGHYYSDTNYILLSMIVERYSDRPFKEYVRQTFFYPLGMRSTYFYSDYLPGSTTSPAPTIQGYLVATKEIRSLVKINPIFKAVPGQKRPDGDLLNTTLAAERVDAAGGIVTTLTDLETFADALFRGKLLSPSSQAVLMSAGEQMEAEQIDKHHTRTLQAMRKPFGVLIYKEGDGPGGINTLMAFLPATNQIFIGFTNIFGNFNEVDFMMDEVIASLVRNKSADH